MICMCDSACQKSFNVQLGDRDIWKWSAMLLTTGHPDHSPLLLVSKSEHPDIERVCHEMDVHLIHERDDYWVVETNYRFSTLIA